MKLIRWVASVFEDKVGHTSHKIIGVFICLWILSRAVQNPVANEIAIYTIAALAFGFAGLTMPEWFSNLKNKKDE